LRSCAGTNRNVRPARSVRAGMTTALVSMGEEQRDRHPSLRPDYAHPLLFKALEVTRVPERQGLDLVGGAHELLLQLGGGGLDVARLVVSHQAQRAVILPIADLGLVGIGLATTTTARRPCCSYKASLKSGSGSGCTHRNWAITLSKGCRWWGAYPTRGIASTALPRLGGASPCDLGTEIAPRSLS